MGSIDRHGLLERLRKYDLILTMGVALLAVLILAALAYHYYAETKDMAADISLKSSDYTTLSTKYDGLSQEYSALVGSNDNLTSRFNNLSDQYNHLKDNESTMSSVYDNVTASLTNLQQKGGPAIAVYYTKTVGGTSDNPQIIVNATAFNLGDREASQFTMHCRIIYNNAPVVNEETFKNVMPLDKRSYTWSFSTLAQVDTVWVEQVS